MYQDYQRRTAGNFAWQDEKCVVFATIEPRSPGHMLVVPREEVDNYLDADPDLLAHLAKIVQIIGQAGCRAFGAPRAFIAVAGFDVPHLHIHVIPTDSLKSCAPNTRKPPRRRNCAKYRENPRCFA
ncbi:HIT family protein [Mobiluncus mulieris]|uniref:HIT family protein n=1 Tax=Mobiluncus mulieris TaxID=2052 RepID=UPI002093C58D|nr:HIT family protein [Mobiluncus mulieris]